MAAACARTLCKVGWNILESPAARRSGTVSYLVGSVGAHGSRRAYGTGGTGVRSKLLSSLRGGGGRVLGCAFLLGGGVGLYQTVKYSVQQHLAEEESKVSPFNVTFIRPHSQPGPRCPGGLWWKVSIDSSYLTSHVCRQGHLDALE